MRFPRLNAKLMNRLCVLALLFAPILYLFGVQWTSLLGAHGEIVLADDVVTSEEIDFSVEFSGRSYQRCFYDGGNHMLSGTFGDEILYFDLFTFVVATYGDFSIDESVGFNVFADYPVDSYVSWYDNGDIAVRMDEIYVDEYPVGFDGICFSFYSFDTSQYYEVFYGSAFGYYRYYMVDDVTYVREAIDFTFTYDQSNYFSWDYSPFLSSGTNLDELRYIPATQPVIQHVEGNPNPTPSENSKYLFENFFPKDNWVTNMGRDVSAGSNPPYGFAPFGTLINYIDENMLHFHETDNSPGLFFYGYSYWCIHVIILDLAVYAIAFIPRIFFKVMNKLEGMDS